MNGSDGRSDRGKSTPRPARALDTVVCVGKAIGQRSPTRDQRGAGTRTATAPHQARRGVAASGRRLIRSADPGQQPKRSAEVQDSSSRLRMVNAEQWWRLAREGWAGPHRGRTPRPRRRRNPARTAGNTQKGNPERPAGAALTAEPLRSLVEQSPVSPAGGSRKPRQRSPGQRGRGGTGRVWSRTSCLQPLLPVELCGPPISQCSGIMPGRNWRNSPLPHQACPLCSCPARIVRAQGRGQPRASRPAGLRQLFEVMLEEDAPPTSVRPVVQASGGRHTRPSRAGPLRAPAGGTGTPTPAIPARDALLLKLARLDLRTGPAEEGRAGPRGVRTKDHALPRLRFPTSEQEPEPDPDPERRTERDPPVDVPPFGRGRCAPARGSAGPGESWGRPASCSASPVTRGAAAGVTVPGGDKQPQGGATEAPAVRRAGRGHGSQEPLRVPRVAFPGGQAGGWDPAMFKVTLVRRDAAGQHLETVCCSPGAPERKRSLSPVSELQWGSLYSPSPPSPAAQAGSPSEWEKVLAWS